LDTDIVIRNDAPDLFDIVPEDAVGVFIEGQLVDRVDGLRDALTLHGTQAHCSFYANTGVLLLPSRLRARFGLSAVKTVLHLAPEYEQGYFNALLHQLGFPVFNISPLFNCMPAVTPTLLEQAFFVHFAGGSLGVRYGRIWEEEFDRDPRISIRTQRQFSSKEVRVCDLRNQVLALNGPLDQIVPASHLLTEKGLFALAAPGVSVLRIEATWDHAIWGPYLALPSGPYRVEILLSLAAYRRAFLDGLEIEGTDPFGPAGAISEEAPKSIGVDITDLDATKHVTPLTELTVDHGMAITEFQLDEPASRLEVHIYGRGSALNVFGLRFREHECERPHSVI
jgi:hypothetical protein